MNAFKKYFALSALVMTIAGFRTLAVARTCDDADPGYCASPAPNACICWAYWVDGYRADLGFPPNCMYCDIGVGSGSCANSSACSWPSPRRIRGYHHPGEMLKPHCHDASGRWNG